MASFSPTILFSSVDLPTFGRPNIATVPATGAPEVVLVFESSLIMGGFSIAHLSAIGEGMTARVACLAGLTTLLATVAVAAPAPSAPPPAAPAGLRLDTAADGALEIHDGRELVGRVALKTPSLRRGVPLLREVVADGHRLAELRVPIRGTAGEEVWLGEVGHSRRVLWSGITGPRDADAESGVGVVADEDGVIEYQTAAGVSRCDGLPVRLFPRGYDFDSGRFRPLVSALPSPGAATLTARRGDPAMPADRPVSGFHWTAASTTRAAGNDARALTPPVELNDADPATSWAEGLGGDGRGEFLTARGVAAGYAVRGLRIVPGDASSAQSFRAKNRLRKLQIALGPAREQRFDVELPQDPAADPARFRDAYWVALPRPVAASCVTVIVTDVFHGSDAAPPKSFGTTAIGELTIFTDLDGPGGADRLVADMAAAPDCTARLPLVRAIGEAAVLPLAQAVTTTRGSARECVVEGLTGLAPAPTSPAVVGALVAAVSGASVKEERLVGDALARAKPAPVAPLAALLTAGSAPDDDRARAARLLARLDDEAAASALLAAAGQGSQPLRAEVADALGRSPRLAAEPVLAAIAAGGAEARQADRLRLGPAATRRTPARAADAVALLRAALAPDRPFEVRARAVMALGALGPAGDPGALAALRAASDDPVLRYLATRELAGPAGGPAARPALRAALTDTDPRVRETAALALAKLPEPDTGPLLIAAAKQEPWPFVRRAQLEALGRVCGPGAGDLMIRAIARDVPDVGRAGMMGLARCKDPRTTRVMLRILASHNETAPARELAANLLGESGDRSATPQLANTLHNLVSQSEADMALEGVAAATLRALARLGGPDALAAAVSLAADTRHPFRRPAVDALGLVCDPGVGRATVQSLTNDPDPGVAAAAASAARRCYK
jgi:HEAT repeat protein